MQQVELTTNREALSALVERIEEGDVIIFTRGGKPVARLTPETGYLSDDSQAKQQDDGELTPERQQRAREAVAGIRALAKRLNLGPFDFEQFKRDRDEGRM